MYPRWLSTVGHHRYAYLHDSYEVSHVPLWVVCIKMDTSGGFGIQEAPVVLRSSLHCFFVSCYHHGTFPKKIIHKYWTVYEICCHVRDIFCHVRDGKSKMTKSNHWYLMLWRVFSSECLYSNSCYNLKFIEISFFLERFHFSGIWVN